MRLKQIEYEKMKLEREALESKSIPNAELSKMKEDAWKTKVGFFFILVYSAFYWPQIINKFDPRTY